MKVGSKTKGENQIKLAEAEAQSKILSFESDWERIMASNQAALGAIIASSFAIRGVAKFYKK